ncbi:MAG TPA: MFS transporter, partial [Bacteroidetes bacterium]|nr:MFS transporter [Bacteroidota bacterium]
MTVKNYLDFIFREWRILVFGASLTFFSSFGQTFLFSLFVPFFLDEFSLTNGTFGSLYSLATLSSAALLPVAGQWIDRIPVKHYSTAVALILALASLIMANSWGLATLFLAIFLLRLAGQGLSGHTAD